MAAGLELYIDGRLVLWRVVDTSMITVGSNPECDLCIPHDDVAPVQFVLQRDGPSLTLLNRDPQGTTVDDEIVSDEMKLAHGDTVVLGAVNAKVCFTQESPGATHTRTLVEERGVRSPGFVVTAPEVLPGKKWDVAERGITLGADPTNDIVLDDPYVSRFHARIGLEAGRCIIRDLDSRNGVFIADRKISVGEVTPGSQVKVGQTLVMVLSQDAGVGSRESAASGPMRMVGVSDVIEKTRKLLRRVATSDVPVLLTGETGTGKEVAARLLREISSRANKAFVAINCGGLTRELIESELFGHERGAFTGAVERKRGAFEAAHGGTLFLDEIGEMPIEMQPQLLRVLENHEVRRLGSTEAFRVDSRVIAATNRRLEDEVAAGRFREDLLHRLNVLVVELPPLRHRMVDLPVLVDHFVADFVPVGETVRLDDSAHEKLRSHTWPGNVRELRNVLQRAILMRASDDVSADDITFTPSTLANRVVVTEAVSSRTLVEIEREAITTELVRHKGNKKEAAAALGVSRSTIHRKIDEYSIDVDSLV